MSTDRPIAELSPSAHLQRTLAASQTDLTRMEGRDADEARAELARVQAEQLQLGSRLAHVTLELEQLRARPWIVARDGGRYCERCEGEVRRGEAYEEQPGTGGLIVHVRCPEVSPA